MGRWKGSNAEDARDGLRIAFSLGSLRVSSIR